MAKMKQPMQVYIYMPIYTCTVGVGRLEGAVSGSGIVFYRSRTHGDTNFNFAKNFNLAIYGRNLSRTS